MFHEIISVLLGLFSGLYGSFVGTTGGAALMIYLLMVWKIVPNQTTLIGTLLFISSIPIGIFGLYEYHKHKSIDYYIGGFLILGIALGSYFGSKYTFILNDTMGEEFGNKLKASITGVIYAILSVSYFYKGFHV